MYIYIHTYIYIREWGKPLATRVGGVRRAALLNTELALGLGLTLTLNPSASLGEIWERAHAVARVGRG